MRLINIKAQSVRKMRIVLQQHLWRIVLCHVIQDLHLPTGRKECVF